MDLYERIYDIVRSVPPGKVTTYGQIAQAVGTRGGARLMRVRGFRACALWPTSIRATSPLSQSALLTSYPWPTHSVAW